MPNNAKISIVGNLTTDPVSRVVKERNVVSFTVAVNTSSKQPDGNYLSNFYSVSVWGKSGEYLMNRLCKGSQVWVNGDLTIAEYTKDGVTRTALRIDATDVRGLQRLVEGNAPAPAATRAPARHAPAQQTDDDMPF